VFLQGFFTEFVSVRGVGFSRHRQYFSQPRRCRAHALTPVCVQCTPGSVAVRQGPEPGPSRGDRGELSVLSIRPFAALPQDRGVMCPRLPSSGSRIMGSSLSCYRVIQVDVPAPFDKGRLVVRRHVYESAYAGVLGRARSRLLGTEGAEALPRWDPSTSCPRWLLNTTCGAPSSWWARG
jgi:hypothetical protein